MRERPPVSVIVPFAGSDDALEELRRKLGSLTRRADDEIIVALNRPSGRASGRIEPGLRILQADAVHTPSFARNRAAAESSGDWLVFVDDDVTPSPTLLERYFDPPPSEETAILAGAVKDVAARPTVVANHVVRRGQMSQTATLKRAGTPYAQSSNCALRRSAFDAVGGFDDEARAGEDADICFRLYRAGWKLEQRPAAIVSHRSRASLGRWLAQLAIHGAGAAWIERRWPGEMPAASWRGFARRLGANIAAALRAASKGDGENALGALLDVAGACAFELGRLLPNRPRRRWGHSL